MLKNQNYFDKNTGVTLPVVAKAQVDTVKGRAIFSIGRSREEIKKGNIIEKIKMDIDFETNRNKNPFELAYETAKGQKLVLQPNEEKGIIEEVLVNQPFYGWEDEV